MKKFVLLMLSGLFLAPALTMTVRAAEIGAVPDAPRYHVRHHRYVERRPYLGCPDHYSCYPLYGAYGPYGGRAYWAAYSGW